MPKVDWSQLWKKEDWWALWVGLLIFLIGLGPFAKVDLIGWAFTSNLWLDPMKGVVTANPAYAFLGYGSVLATYIFLLALLTLGAAAMRYNIKRFVAGFTVIFWLTAIVWILASNAYSAVTPNAYKQWGISWSLNLTNEGGYIYLLLVGLVIRNVFRGFAQKLADAARPEWFIKTAIVILGATIGVQAAGAVGIATAVMFRGLSAIVEAYLIYWPLVYFISRKYFKVPKEWAAPLASGISVCGVSAAIATGAAVKSRPRIPITLSSIIVAFAVVELIVLPWLSYFLYPATSGMVFGAWMGLAVKTDGAAAASGALVDALIVGKAATLGQNLAPGWMLTAAVTTKLFIDVFIGVWAVVLAVIWSTSIERRAGEKFRWMEVWYRFPKFVIGYFITFLIMLAIASAGPAALASARLASGETNAFRVFFFALTFLSIGLVTDFRAFRKEGLGKMVLIYVLCLFGFILWIGLFVSWIFFNGVPVPLVKV
ncbi:MAG: putative sulfate exporter family transporter [Candidatus Bathyarchaeia archaeon]|jgi:uncharacterized membrane protein YadS